MSKPDPAYDAALLHRPDRLQQIRGLSEHVETTANLSRALWAHLAALAGGDPSDRDLCERDVRGLLELADILADHASAARFCHARGIE